MEYQTIAELVRDRIIKQAFAKGYRQGVKEYKEAEVIRIHLLGVDAEFISKIVKLPEIKVIKVIERYEKVKKKYRYFTFSYRKP